MSAKSAKFEFENSNLREEVFSLKMQLDSAITARKAAEADAAAMREKLISVAYKQGTDSDGWYRECTFCGEECRLPDRDKLAHSVACVLSPSPGAALLARLKALEEALEWIEYHTSNQDLGHVDFRVEAGMRAAAALKDPGE